MVKFDINVMYDAFVRVLIANLPGKERILDIGSGDCSFRNIYPFVDSQITFTDLKDSDGLYFQKAMKELKDNEYYKFVETSAEDLSMFPDGSFDMVTMLSVVEHLTLEQQEKCFSEVYRVLSPAGLFVLAAPNREGRKLVNKYMKHPGHIEEPSFDEINNLLIKHNFKIINENDVGIIRLTKSDYNKIQVDPVLHADASASYCMWLICAKDNGEKHYG
jgi:ubiquinone/menaquinone biosynthesis C-methylase UbiE